MRTSAGSFGTGRVSVQRRRGSLSLRVDGTYASSYQPGSALTGSVWDALAAPLAWLPRDRRRSVLILGLGGGSAARLARELAPKARIVGVEASGEVIKAARRWFELDALDVQVVHGCARQYLRRCRARFDLVIEDVFVGRGRSVHKPDWLPDPGLVAASRRVNPGGLLVSNSIDETAEVAATVRSLYPSSVRIAVEDYDNTILVGGPGPLDARGLRMATAAHPLLRQTLPKLRFRRG
ncbi:MAG: methyltransferase domain-containing protein [Myxococcota bacterium]